MADVAMPRLSDSMEEGTILKWLKSDGDEVKRGEELVEIETDKANMTYEADSDGTLKIVAKEGDTLAVGETIASIGGGSEGDDSGDDEEPKASEDEQPEGEADDSGEEQKDDGSGEDGSEEEEEPSAEEDDSGDEESRESGNGKPTETPEPAPARAESDAPSGNGDGDGRVKASPVAKRMAREMGVELAALEGSGPGGRIVKADVEAAAKSGGGKAATAEAEAPPEREQAAPEDEAPEDEAKPEKRDVPGPVTPGERDEQGVKGETTHQELTRLQKTIARRMAESKATAPEFVLNVEIDMEEAVALRKQLKVAADDQPAPSFNDFVIKASALALKDFPRANGAYRDGEFELYSRVNVGVAVAGQDALVVPTVFDADVKSIGQIARESRAVAERVRAGVITPPELSGGTFTVSNLGMFGIKRFTAVINPPQAAILAVGALEPRAVVRDGKVVVRNTMELTLACDHRILYGAEAAEFLGRIREYLEQPLKLAL
jgi:pyruvate dehydrogenase E2 component (dihydrolipoamide acetyltransferase)